MLAGPCLPWNVAALARVRNPELGSLTPQKKEHESVLLKSAKGLNLSWLGKVGGGATETF